MRRLVQLLKQAQESDLVGLDLCAVPEILQAIRDGHLDPIYELDWEEEVDGTIKDINQWKLMSLLIQAASSSNVRCTRCQKHKHSFKKCR